MKDKDTSSEVSLSIEDINFLIPCISLGYASHLIALRIVCPLQLQNKYSGIMNKFL